MVEKPKIAPGDFGNDRSVSYTAGVRVKKSICTLMKTISGFENTKHKLHNSSDF